MRQQGLGERHEQNGGTASTPTPTPSTGGGKTDGSNNPPPDVKKLADSSGKPAPAPAPTPAKVVGAKDIAATTGANGKQLPPVKADDKTAAPKADTQGQNDEDQPPKAVEASPVKLEKGAEGKVMVEIVPATAELLKMNEKDLATKLPDASKVLRGIDMQVEGQPSAFYLSLKAMIKTGSDFAILEVSHQRFNTSKDKVDALSATLANPLQPDVQNPAGDLVAVSAVCTDDLCSEVQVRLDFKVDSGTLPVVFALSREAGYVFATSATRSNFPTEVGTFDAAFKIFKGVEEAKGNKVGEKTEINKGAPAAGAAKEVAKPGVEPVKAKDQDASKTAPAGKDGKVVAGQPAAAKEKQAAVNSLIPSAKDWNPKFYNPKEPKVAFSATPAVAAKDVKPVQAKAKAPVKSQQVAVAKPKPLLPLAKDWNPKLLDTKDAKAAPKAPAIAPKSTTQQAQAKPQQQAAVQQKPLIPSANDWNPKLLDAKEAKVPFKATTSATAKSSTSKTSVADALKKC